MAGALVAKEHKFIVKVAPPKETSEGGIYIPEETRDRLQLSSMQGTVVSIGENCWDDIGNGEKKCKVGDTVVFAKHAGHTYEHNGEIVWFLLDTDLMAVIENE